MESVFRSTTLVILGLGLTNAMPAAAGPVDIYEACVAVNGTVYDVSSGCGGESTPANIEDDIETNPASSQSGLGAVTVSLSGVGDYVVGMFVDADIDVADNGYDNESYGSGGTAASGQSFEVDEPGYGGGGYIGDIFFNFEDGAFDNDFMVDLVYGDGGSTPEDISLGLGWDFSLADGEQAVITYLLSATRPTSGFWISQLDYASEYRFFFSSTLEITGSDPEPQPVPEPGTLLLFGAGLLGLARRSRRTSR